MAKALRRGLGTSTNLVETYAWLKLFAASPSGFAVGRVELNQLALALDTAALNQAEALAAEFKAGHWRAPAVRAIAEGDAHLKLTGISWGGKTPLALINGKTFSEGESGPVPVKPGTLNVKCLTIKKDSVLILVEGEDAPRVLR